MKALVVVLCLAASPVAAQASTTSVSAWRSGLEVSVNGSEWHHSINVVLTKAQCPPSSSSPCAPGSAVAVDIRFPSIPAATDLSKTRAQVGEPPGPPGSRYEVRLVRSLSSPLCAVGFTATTAANTPRLAVNVGAPGSPLPLTCRWAALVGVSESQNSSHVTAVWSDTVVVQLSSKP